MQVILLERVEKLGAMGDVVDVRPGYARNFLLPQNKALRASKDNVAYFEAQKKTIQAESDKRKTEAEKTLKKVDGVTVTLIRAASEGGQLYGSVTARDIAEAVNAGVGENTVSRKQVVVEQNYKSLGLYPMKVMLHPEVPATVTINIARSNEEAKMQLERGEALVSGEQEAALEEQAIAAAKAEEAAVQSTDAETSAEEETENAA